MTAGRNTADLEEARRRKHAGWIAEIARGGKRAEDAMKQLFKDYEGRMTRWLRWEFRVSLAEAEDLWQEAVLAIWSNASKFDPVTNARDWIYRITRNKAIDLDRQARRMKGAFAANDKEVAETTAALPSEVSDVDRCVRLAYESFAQKHPDKAEWILKADVLEHDIPDIAREMGRTEGATRTRLKELPKVLRPFIEKCRELLEK